MSKQYAEITVNNGCSGAADEDEQLEIEWMGECNVVQELPDRNDDGIDRVLVINSVSERQGGVKGIKVPAVTLIVNGQACSALLDTGAGRTIVKAGVLRQDVTDMSAWKSRLVDFSGQSIPILGTKQVDFTVSTDRDSNPTRLTQTVAVLGNNYPSKFQILVGTDLLNKYQAKLDFANRRLTLTIAGKTHEIPIHELDIPQRVHHTLETTPPTTTSNTQPNEPQDNTTQPNSAHSDTSSHDEPSNDTTQSPDSLKPPDKRKPQELSLHADVDFVLEPLEQRILTVNTRIPDGEYCIQRGSADSGILVCEALVKVKEGLVPLMLLNAAPTLLKVEKGTKLATISRLRQINYIKLGMTLGQSIESTNIIASEVPPKQEPKQTNPTMTNLPDPSTLPPITPDEVDVATSNPDVRNRLTTLLNNYRDVVAKKGEPLGLTNLAECSIETQPEASVAYRRQYPLPFSQRTEIDQQVQELLERGVIEESDSPYNAPVLLVKKKDGTSRFVVDFRLLNSTILPQRMSIPNIADLLISFRNAKVFSSLDLESAFWQIPIPEKDRPKTAFTTSTGRYQFRRMPFGVSIAPGLFSKCMSAVLGEAMGIHALAYIDDIIIASTTLEKHFKSLEVVLQKLRRASLRVKLVKCEFLKKEIGFLGHQIGPDGVKLHPSHLASIKNYPSPRDQKGVRSFLGFLSYFRGFVNNFSQLAEPLNRLLKKDQPFIWTDEQEQSVAALKEKLIKAPVLAYPDFSKAFHMFTDASGVGVGAVLMQADADGRLHPLSFASRSLSPTERRYSTTKREALAVLWALKNYRHLILGYPINCYTDHKPLSYIFRKSLPDGALGRWAILTQEYCPKIVYVKGKLNNIADALSRAPYSLSELEKDSEDLKTVAETEDFEQIPSHVATVEESLPDKVAQRLPQLAWTVDELVREQRDDPDLRPIISRLDPKVTPRKHKTKPLRQSEPPEMTEYLLSGDILHKRITVQRCGQDHVYWAIMVPKSLIRRAVLLCHENFEFGHLGVARTLANVRTHFYFDNISTVATEIIKSCDNCQRYNKLPPQATPVRTSPLPHRPWEEVSMDILGPLPCTERGNRYIITMIDLLTRYIIIVPIPDRTSHTVARVLREYLFAHYGAPTRLLSDNALEFNADVIQKLCQHYHVKKINTTPYRPAANGVVENRNHSIVKLLRIYVGEFSPQWDIYVPEVMISINTAPNVTSGDNPHFLLYGYDRKHVVMWDKPIPTQPMYNLDDLSAVREKQSRLVHQFIRDRMHNQLQDFQRKHNLHTRSRNPLFLNQRVYLRHRPRPDEHAKLSPRWEGPYVVTRVHTPFNYTLTHTTLNKQRRAHIDDIIPIYPHATQLVKTQKHGLAEYRPTAYDSSEDSGDEKEQTDTSKDATPKVSSSTGGQVHLPLETGRRVTRSQKVPDHWHTSLP